MALAPLLYNITFDSQTRILYFWDKAGHEIYHCEIPSPAPALPTVSMSYAYPNQIWNYSVNIGAGASSVLRDQDGNALSYDSTKSYSALNYYTSTSDSSGIIDTNVSIGASGSFLALFNNGSSQITVQRVNVATCDSTDANVITVYDSSNNPYNAFKYTASGTDYYYVLDGIQTDWTDDLSSIGYHLPAQSLELVVCFPSSGISVISFSANDYWYGRLLSNEDKTLLIDFGGEIISNTNLIKATPSFFYEVADIYTGNGTGSIPTADLSNFRCAIGTEGYPGALNIKSTNAYSGVMTWKVRITKVPNVAWVKADKSSDWTGYAGSLSLYDDNGNIIVYDSTKTYIVLGYYTSETAVDLSRMDTEHNYGLSIINDSGYCKVKWADSGTTLLIQRVIYKVE